LILAQRYQWIDADDGRAGARTVDALRVRKRRTAPAAAVNALTRY